MPFDVYSKTISNDPDGKIVSASATPDFVVRLDVPAGTTGNVDFTTLGLPKCRVVDVFGNKGTGAGGGAGSLQVMNGATANNITDAISINVAAGTRIQYATLTAANQDLAAGATVRVVRTRTASTDEAATLYLRCVLVA